MIGTTTILPRGKYCLSLTVGESWRPTSVDAAIEAGIYMKADNYRMPSPVKLSASPNLVGGERQLVFNWQPPESKDSLIEGAAIKITKLGIRQEDAVVNINLAKPDKPVENQEETEIMAAVVPCFIWKKRTESGK